MPELREVWVHGFDGVDLSCIHLTEEAAKAAVLTKFADHWTAEGVTKTDWVTYEYANKVRRQSLRGNNPSHRHPEPEPCSNTGWFVQPVPVGEAATDA
jgi:hypothetical protein